MTSKNLITVVTGHQLTADTIAAAIGATEKHAGFYYGNGYAVTWTNGSVIESTFKPTEGFVLSSSMNPKHVFAHNFRFAMRNYDELVGYKKSALDIKQLATVKSLWNMSSLVINAMSPDIDGEIDFLSLYYYLGIPVETRRAWLPILTKPEIVKGIENGPEDIARYIDWYEAGIYNRLIEKCEQEADYKTTPLFVEVPVETASQEVEALKYVGIESPSSGSVTITDFGIYQYTDKPTLFNLTQLLIAGAVELDFTHEKTIKTALTLYGKKLISYPMVEQNYIPEEIWHKMLHNREVLRHNAKWGNTIKGHKVTKRHNFSECMNPYYGFGIVTTGIHPTDLTRDEEKLYNVIVKRVIDAFRTARQMKAMQRNIQRRMKSGK